MKRRAFLRTAAAVGAAGPVADTVRVATAAGPTEQDVQRDLDRRGVAELPPGEVIIQRGLALSPNTILRGSGWETVLRAATGLNNPVIRLVQPDAAAAEKEIQGCGIEDLRLVGGGARLGIHYGADPAVRGSNPRSCWMRGLRIEGFRTGIAVDFAEGGHLAECKFIGNSIALFVGDAASGMQVTHSDFRHNAAGLQLYATQASNEWLISACHFESNTGTAVSLAGAQSWAFVRCKWEGNAAHVALEWPNSNNVSLRPDGHQFIGGTFNRTAGTAPGMTVDHGTLLILQGCTASAGLATALVFRGGWANTLIGCNVRRSQIVAPDGAITVVGPGLRA